MQRKRGPHGFRCIRGDHLRDLYHVFRDINHSKILRMLKQTKFSTNWNKKLFCTAFTTLRRPSPYYQVGDIHEILLNGFAIKTAKIIAIDEIPTDLLKERECRLDTGLSKHETVEIFTRMYGSIPPKMYFITFLTQEVRQIPFRERLLCEIDKLSAQMMLRTP